jgi:type I restriction enzyme S subunit
MEPPQDWGLPEGWTSVQLRDHVYIAGRIGWRGLKRSEYTENGPLFLAVKDIRPNGEVDFSQTDHISKARYVESPEIQLQRRDILLTKDGTIGKVGMVDALPSETTVNSSILVVRPLNDLLLDRFLFHFLRGPQFQEIARERIAGSAVPHLFQKDIKELSASVPPAAEQWRIVTELELLLSKADASRDRLAKVPKIFKRFRQSVLAAACSGRLTEGWRNHQGGFLSKPQGHYNYDFQAAESLDLPEAWDSADVEAVCSEVVDCPHSTPKWTEHGVICLRTTNFRAGSLDLTEVRYVSESTYKERIARLEPRGGDVLYSREGGILGLSCMVPSGTRLCLGQRMMLMRAKRELYHPAFLMHVLNSPDINSRVRDLTGGSASPHLNVATIKAFPVPVPQLREQHEIVRRVEALFKLADAIKKRVEAATKRADKLTQAILAKAFRGELVPTEAELARREGRTYEPASALLERIRAEHRAVEGRHHARRQGKN